MVINRSRSNFLRLVLLTAMVAGVRTVSPARGDSSNDPLPSWNPGSAKDSILTFVKRVTRADSPDFVLPADRIVVTDLDGTLWPEQPMPVELFYAIDQVKALAPQHPEWQTQPPFQAVLESDREALLASGKAGLVEIVAATHAGMTTDVFTRQVQEWIATARHPQTGMRFTEMVYQPMRELLDYLRIHRFKVHIVSGSEVGFTRSWSEPVLGIPPEQVIGSVVKTQFELQEATAVLVRQPELVFYDDKDGKPRAIEHFMGRRPIAAFGNSNGDVPMLQWAQSGDGARYMLLVHHTDGDREWAYDRQTLSGQLTTGLDTARANGWTVVDMKQDWRAIYAAQGLNP
jgi:phosphoserine phosphatase